MTPKQARLLRAAIIEAGMSVKQVAADMGMSLKTFYSRLNGHTNFDSNEIKRLCDLLQIMDPLRKCEIFLE